MYTLLIADDEYFILERLKRMLEQEQHDFTLLAACANGKDAMEKIEALRPDLAILDIKMPFLSGLEIAGQIKARGLPTRVILLTSFDLFDFAQQAVSYQVFSYLLKPIKAEELLRVLREARHEIEQTHAAAALLQRCDEQMREQALCLFLSGSALTEPLRQALSPLVSAQKQYRLFLLKISGQDTPEPGLLVSGILRSLLPAESFFCAGISEAVSACVCDAAGCSEDFAGRLQRLVCDGTHGNCSVACCPAAAPEALPAMMQQALPQLYQTIFSGPNSIVSAAQPLSPSQTHSFDLYHLLGPCLQQRDLVSAKQTLRACFQTLASHASVRNLELFLSEFFLTCNLFAQQTPAGRDGLFFQAQLLLESSACLQEIEDRCLQYVDDCCVVPAAGTEGTLTASVRKVVQESYGDPALSLPYISKKLGYTANYISTVFKRETGISVVQFITEQRMLVARQLLRGKKLSVNAVCEMVGYTSPFYFSRRYKEYFGHSPSDAVHL